MPTRGRKVAAENTASKPLNQHGSQATHGSATLTDNPANSSADMGNTAGSVLKETIGSRLRKRRRTDISPSGDLSLASKRVQTKKVSSTVDPDESPAPASTPIQSHQEIAPHSSVQGFQSIPATDTEALSLPQQPPFGGPPADGPDAQDFNAVIADIINHGESVDNHYATRNHDPSMVDSGSLQQISASFTLKTQSLSVLENLATQILEMMAKSTYHEILTIATKPETEPGQAYATLRSLFDHTKKVYSVQEPFLKPYELGLVEVGQIEIIRKANMATFVSSVFGSQDVGFYHLNENFLDTFVADGNRLLKSQAQLFLELKTQAYISAVQNTDRSREDILEDLFPSNLEELLLKRRPGAKQLAPSEADFVQRAKNRRRALLDEASSIVSIKDLPDKYVWEAFLRDVSTYVSKNFETIVGIAAPKPIRPTASNYEQKDHQEQQYRRQPQFLTQNFNPQTQLEEIQALQSSAQASMPPTAPMPNNNDIGERAAQAAEYAIQGFNDGQASVVPQQPPLPAQTSMEPHIPGHKASKKHAPQIQYHFEHPLHPNVPAPPLPYYQNGPDRMSPGRLYPSIAATQSVPYPTQSAPTQVLYERARKVATAKASPTNRRASHPSQRRPWTTEEESSLMAGLDRVKGPHWSQILAMFGPGGTINEVLKDRNQVQLKDKARNLKLFFLKSGIEVPYYLQFVTGELKTRAPARAAKNEAKEKGTTDEDRAHVQGLMALASGAPTDADQMATPGLQLATPAPNGHVPMADMGTGPELNGLQESEVPIDPQVTDSVASRVGVTPFNTEKVGTVRQQPV